MKSSYYMNNPVSHYMYLVTEEKLRITERGVKEGGTTALENFPKGIYK